MKQTYRITREVVTARGKATWLVRAESEADALDQFDKLGGVFEDEEIEATEYDKPKATPVRPEQS